MASIEEAKRTDVQIAELKVSQFLDKNFVELIESKFEGIQTQHICFYITKKDEKEGKKKYERIMISHDSPENEENKLTNISASRPEILERLLETVKELLG
ncbi:MAG: hypothetical protein E3J35_00230 [Methanomassiliicoccales archaeon]|nr:MAG: hypothetical protein E3J35_00230 [Methanomassiliicoccales archaeon]